jgi:hypothetical protein
MEIQDALNFNKRMIPSHSDDLHFFRARIYRNSDTAGDDRIQVRILPYMEDILETDLMNLPWFPSLNSHKVIRGLPEMLVGPEDAGLVLVLSNSDFTMGWVVCPLNAFPDSYDKLEYNWDFTGVKDILGKMGVTGKNFNYAYLEVNQYYMGVSEGEFPLDPTEAGGQFFEITNILNGNKVFFNSNLSCIALVGNKVMIVSRAGIEDNMPQSVITVEPGEIKLRSRQITLDYDINLNMGKGGGYVPRIFGPAVPTFTSTGMVLFGDPQVNI